MTDQENKPINIDEFQEPKAEQFQQPKKRPILNIDPKLKRYFIHGCLFLLTLITTTLAGTEWIEGKFIFYSEGYTWNDFLNGLYFSIPFLGILTAHEFGHYFVAKFHKVKTSLPYFLPMWFGFIGAPSLGTLGAIIRLDSITRSRKQYFDIGIAGPLAGFVVALLVLTYGFANLPPKEDIFKIHPEYAQYGLDYPKYVYNDSTESIIMGSNLLFEFFKTQVADPDLLPHDNELMHYPFIFAGFLALFFTALNLIPVGQLDGGHVLYGLIGAKGHRYVASAVFVLFVFFAGLGLFTPYDPMEELLWAPIYVGFLYLVFSSMPLKLNRDKLMLAVAVFTLQFLISYFDPTIIGFEGWLLFAFVIGRFLGVQHPPVSINTPLDTKRKILGWIALIIFVLCFSPSPLIIA